jgi:hypothetical protein
VTVRARTYLLLLESGAGGHFANRATATQFAKDHVESGWLLRCRHEGPSLGDRTALVDVVGTFGRPAFDALPIALQLAGERHGIVYSLVPPPAVAMVTYSFRHTVQPPPPFSLPAEPSI